VALDIRPPGNSSNALIQLAGSGIDTLQFVSASSDLSIIKNVSNSALRFGTNNTEVARFSATGNFGIGTTSPWRTLSVTGTMAVSGLTAGAGAGSLCLTSGKEVVYSDNAGCTGSSLRFKHDIADLDALSGIEETLKLRPVSFVYNDDIGVKGIQVGFIAEEVHEIDPRLTTLDASGTPTNVKYMNMVAIAIKAIQELWAKVQDLGQKVAALLQSDDAQNAKIQTLEARVQSLESQLGAAATPSNPPQQQTQTTQESPPQQDAQADAEAEANSGTGAETSDDSTNLPESETSGSGSSGETVPVTESPQPDTP
jgi:hypothetical protein